MPSQLKPRWNSNLDPIVKVEALASILDLSVPMLDSLCERVDLLWKPGKTLVKKNGETRQTHDALPELKQVHEKIKNRILKQVQYPKYLHGGIADRRFKRSIDSNARMHCRKRVLIEEDIENFFPNISARLIQGIWRYFFNYSEEVSTQLTRLVTYKGETPQGWRTSNYLANLTFFDTEPELDANLRLLGFVYSRFTDDITLSSRKFKDHRKIQQAISLVYTMLRNKGFSPKRSKHAILTPQKAMMVTGMQVNAYKPKLPTSKANNTRAIVHQVELVHRSMDGTKEYRTRWTRAASMVGRLRALDKKAGEKLRARLLKVRPSR